MKNKLICFILICISITYGAMAQSLTLQDVEYDENIADSEARRSFYQGINLFNYGYIPEALSALQRSLVDNDKLLYQYMYARANRAYGLLDQSNVLYQTLMDKNFLESFIRGKLELSRLGRKDFPNANSLQLLVRNSSFDVTDFGYFLPMSTRVLPNGNIAIVFLQSQDIIVLSPTGKIEFELGTGVLGVNNPTDILYTQNERFLVNSFSDNKIFSFSSEGGNKSEFIISPSVGDVEYNDFSALFSGPQFMAEDDEGNIYVTAYGSALVFKFSRDGEFLFSFGSSIGNFSGLEEPTGIEIIKDKIYVADYVKIDNKKTSGIYVFDLNGNFFTKKNVIFG